MKRLLLSVLAITTAGFAFSQCSDLFFSEYVEGSGQNNGLEIYNPTQNTIDLSGYVVKRYSNGSGTETESLALSGMLLSGDVVVVINGQTDSVWVDPPGYWSVPTDPAFYAKGDIFDVDYPAPMYFNGDDAITLETTGGSIVDIFGKVGEDPGSAWTDDATAGYTDANGGTWWTKRQTLIRKSSVQDGVTMNPTEFNATLEWDSLPDDTWDSLGFHTCGCATLGINQPENIGTDAMYIFPNPIVAGNFEVKATGNIDRVEVYDVIGRMVYKQAITLNSGSVRVSLGKISEGVYLVQTALENGSTLTKKVLVK